MSFLIRVQLPDRPCALGAVATALGRAGGDIDSVDIVERGPGTAVDDLVVDLPPGGLPDGLVTAVGQPTRQAKGDLAVPARDDDLHRSSSCSYASSPSQR